MTETFGPASKRWSNVARGPLPPSNFSNKIAASGFQPQNYPHDFTKTLCFVVEKFPAMRTLGAWMQVGDERFTATKSIACTRATTIRCRAAHQIKVSAAEANLTLGLCSHIAGATWFSVCLATLPIFGALT